jgi:hypothetical protein
MKAPRNEREAYAALSRIQHKQAPAHQATRKSFLKSAIFVALVITLIFVFWRF